MGEWNFNTRQCIRALLKLGFILGNKRSGQHDKYYPPAEIQKKLNAKQSHFIMVPRHNDLHCQNLIVSELKAMGGDDLVNAFRKLL